jgi:hypothetical protein
LEAQARGNICESRGFPAFDRESVEFEAPTLNEDGLSNEINHDIGSGASGELDFCIEEPNGFSEFTWIIWVQMR